MNAALDIFTGVDIDKEVASLSPEQARDMLYLVSEILGDVEDAPGAEVVEVTLPKSVETVKARHYKTMDKITGDLDAGKISRKAYEKKAHDAVSTSFADAYEMGRGKALDAGDLEYLSRAVDEEMKYARKFGRDIEAKRLRMPRQRRADMYAETLDGVAWNGRVESMPDDVRIDWMLGDAEHCIDCLILAANGPYTKWNLPTTPRAGSTACKSNCRCRIVQKRGRMSKAEMAEANEYSKLKDQGMADMLAPGQPPKGMRIANVDRAIPNQLSEQEYINSLRNRINYNRRTIAVSDDAAEVKAAIRARKIANEELIEFLEKEKIYETPLWSVDEVINETHLSAKAEADIFRHGIDGDSLEVLSRREVASLVDRYEREVGEKFEELAKYGKPKVRSKREVKEEDLAPLEVRPTEYSLVAEDITDTFKLLGKALLSARGKSVQVGPLNDELLSRAYVWMRGEDAMIVVNELQEGDIDFAVVPVDMPRRKGK